MTDDRRRRFSQIERPRAPGAEAPDASPGTDARFGSLGERPAAAPPPAPDAGDGASPADPFRGAGTGPVARGHTDRFRPPAEQPLEVDDRAEASQPFIRCARCETDSSRFAARCTTCGELLDTDEQRRFNERLWGERRAQAEVEAGERAAREAELERARGEDAAVRHAAAVAMARDVGDRERRRLDAEVYGQPSFGPPDGGFGGGWGTGDASPGGGLFTPGVPVGFKLLGLLPPAWRVGVGVAAVAVAAGLFLAHPAAGLVAGVVLASLLTPARWRFGRRSRW